MRDDLFLRESFFDYTIRTTYGGAAAARTYTPATGFRGQLLAMVVEVTTDANVANRRLVWEFRRNGQPYLAGQAPVQQSASTTIDYYFAPGLSESTVAITAPDGEPGRVLVRLPYPPVLVGTGNSNGWQIYLEVTSDQAGDDISQIDQYLRAVVNAS